MTSTVAQSYQLVSHSHFPLWLVLLVLAAAVAGAWWLVRGELRARAVRRRILVPLRLTLVALAGILLLQPQLLIRREEQRPGALLLVADRSRSMLRTDPWPATPLLDLATLLQVPAPAREPAAGEALVLLAGIREQVTRWHATLQRQSDQAAQGLPPVADAELPAARQAEEAGTWSLRLRECADRIAKPAVAAAPATPVPAAAPTVAPVATLAVTPAGTAATTLEAVAKACSDLAGDLRAMDAATPDAARLARTLALQQDLLARMGASLAAVRAQQATGDEAALAGLAPVARQALADLAHESRFRLASRLAHRVVEPPAWQQRHRIQWLGWDELTPAVAQSATDLYAPLEQAVREHAGDTVSGIVLFSDGQQNSAERPDVLRAIRSRGIPFVAVGTGSTEPGIDIAVADWRAPASALPDASVAVQLLLKTQAPEGTPVEVSLTTGTGAALARQRIECGKGPWTALTLSFRAPAEGRHLLRLHAAAATPDAAPDNDEARFALDVWARRPGVLLVARAPRWDLAGMMRALTERPCRVDTAFWGAAAAESADAAAPAGAAASAPRVPKDLAGWQRYALVIAEPSPWPGRTPETLTALRAYVEGGGVLLLCSGPASANAVPALLPWLPRPQATPPGSPAALRPEGSAAFHPAVALSGDATRSARAWLGLPPVRDAAAALPQTLTLLAARAQVAAPGSDNVPGSAASVPVLTLGFYGRGRIYHLAGSDLYRLREWHGARTVDRFLGALLDDALRPLFTGADAKVALDRAAPLAGEEAATLVQAERAPEGNVAPEKTHLTAATPLAFEPCGTGLWRARFRVPPAGPCLVRVTGFPDAAFESVPAVSAEDIEFRLDEARLRALAADAGGTYVPLLELPAALERVCAPRRDIQVSVREIRLWNLWGCLLLFTGCAVLDWVVRRRSGLVL